MNERAGQLIAELGLVPHPEGGHYREIHRSTTEVRPLDGRPARAALTTIYFLLSEGEVSRWHRVASDEVWYHLEGDPLDLHVATPGFQTMVAHGLGPLVEGLQPVHVVPADSWQAARSRGAYSLVSCTVGPGFDFQDFELIEPASAEAATVRERHPVAAKFI